MQKPIDIEALIKMYADSGVDQAVGFELSLAISLVHHSSVIKGAKLTKTESRLLIEKEITPGGKPLKYSLMVLDHYEAYQYMMEEAKKKSPFSHHLIGKINTLLVKRTGEATESGNLKIDFREANYRTNYNMDAGDTKFTHNSNVAESMDNYVLTFSNFLNTGHSKTIAEKVKAAFSAHYEFVCIHPFGDGNGRTSRLLMNYILAYFQLPLCVVRSENRDSYIDALVMSDNSRDVSYIHNFLLSEYGSQLKKEVENDTRMKQRGSHTFVL